jgi:hypothetical protein
MNSSVAPIRTIGDWWFTQGRRAPIGPISTEVLLDWIVAGEILDDAMVCDTEGTTWKSIDDVAAFSSALREVRDRQRFDEEGGVHAEPKTIPVPNHSPTRYDFEPEHDDKPFSTSPSPPLRASLRFDEEEERTIVDKVPLFRSELPE